MERPQKLWAGDFKHFRRWRCSVSRRSSASEGVDRTLITSTFDTLQTRENERLKAYNAGSLNNFDLYNLKWMLGWKEERVRILFK